MYRRIVENFGPHDTWDLRDYPNDESKESFDEFCKNAAGMIGAKSADAVKNQIAWATTTQDEVGESHMETWYRNKVAAKEAGFITNKDMPKRVVCEY